MNYELSIKMTNLRLRISRDELLGDGRTAKVFKGELDNQKVAVKRIQLVDANKFFDREVEGMTDMNHLNVLKLLAVHEDNNFKYIVLEFCVASVHNYCIGKYTGEVPPNPNALYQMADGLYYIHSHQVAHRDISTGNVLIYLAGHRPVMKIADFGICKPASENGSFSLSQIAQGTEHFIAPELLVKMQSNESGNVRGTMKSDIFSLGCVFFKFLLKKGHPFEDESKSYFQIQLNVMAKKYSLNSLDENYAFAKPVIEKMIQDNPANRITLDKVMENLKPHLVEENQLNE